MVIPFSLAVVVLLAVGLSQQHVAPKHFGPLRFKDDGTFQISIFEDLHFGENAWDQWGPQQDINSVKVLNRVLDAESPGLVVLNGDLITGENTFIENSTTYVDQIVAPLVQRDLTWASTYGNHDSDFNLSRSGILAREHLWPNSRTAQMVHAPKAGVSNYYLPVYAANGNSPELLLWFFDSRGGFLFQQKDANGNRVGQEDWVDASVVEWFNRTNAQLVKTHRRTIPSLVFVHIPTNASFALQASARGVDPHTEPGVNDDNPLAQQAQGWCPDGTNNCPYGGQDVLFMQAITAAKGVMAVFSGHDHGATWCYAWTNVLPGMSFSGNGVKLCFGQHSGYGGYGNWMRGARQVRASLAGLVKFEVDTWIRLENGDIISSVTLNSTYGQDVYPETPNIMSFCPTCNYTIITPGPPN